MKRDGSERKPNAEGTPSKEQKVLFADEKAIESDLERRRMPSEEESTGTKSWSKSMV